MKAIISWSKHPHMARFSVLFITIVLIAGMVSCNGDGVIQYDLTVDSTAGGSVTAPGEGTFPYTQGATINLIAEADDGYEFINWTGDVGTVGDVNDSATAITMNGDYSITANFAVAIYDLTISSTAGGSVTGPGEGTFPYYEETVVDLVAEAEEGYRFGSWTGDVDTIDNVSAATTAITVNGDYSITAGFVKQYDLSVSSTSGGNVTTPGEGIFTYDAGAVVSLVATSDDDFRFVEWTGDVSTVGSVNTSVTNITMDGDYTITANFEARFAIATGLWHTVGLKADGTVIAVGSNDRGQCDVGGWTDIVQIDAGAEHTVGLKSDGTVVAAGWNGYGQCNVGDWTDIMQIAAARDRTIGLKADGTVVAVGLNEYGQCNVGDWTDIVQVAAGYVLTVGLESDGTVVAVGDNTYGGCNVGGWTDVTQVAAGFYHTVGLKVDGTVVAVGPSDYGMLNVSGWTGIIQVEAGTYHTVGLKSDHTVVAVGSNFWGELDVGGWTDIIQVSATNHTAGLKVDGTVVAVGLNDRGQCNVSGWDLN